MHGEPSIVTGSPLSWGGLLLTGLQCLSYSQGGLTTLEHIPATHGQVILLLDVRCINSVFAHQTGTVTLLVRGIRSCSACSV